MVGADCALDGFGVGLGVDGEHGGVPCFVVGEHVVVPGRLAVFQVGAFERVADDVEEEVVFADAEIFHVAVAHGLLGVGVVSPVKLARYGWKDWVRGKHVWKQADSVERVVGIGLPTSGFEEGGDPVHRNTNLVRGVDSDVARPAGDGWDAEAAFEQLHLGAGEGPYVGESLAAVVAGEDHDRVVGEPILVEGFEDTAYLLIHRDNHAGVGGLVAAVVVGEVAGDALGFGFVVGAFPRPVRRVEVERDEKWLFGFGVVADGGDGAVAEEVGEVAVVVDEGVLIPEVVGVGGGSAGFVGEVVELAAAEAVEVVVSGFEWAEVGEPAEVPLADQGGSVAGLFQ